MRIVVPTISREKAIDLFSSAGSTLAAKLRRQPTTPTRTELLYLPYYCFEIELSGSTADQRVCVAVDGLVANAILFVKDDLERAAKANETCCEFDLSRAAAREIAVDGYKRMLLEHGLRNKTTTTVGDISDAESMLYPFWVGYFKKGDTYDFKALDAVSGEVQGVRMRKVFLSAFRQLEKR